MEIVAMKFKNADLRAFYRLYILPRHIAKRTGDDKAALEDELAGHLAHVTAHRLEKDLERYVAAQDAKQAAYNTWQTADAADKAALEVAFRDMRAAFVSKYH